jgi:hypothetical protein
MPAEALLSFRDAFAEYQSVTVRSAWLGAAGSRQHALSFSGSLDAGQGRALLDDWLKRTWSQRETATFFTAAPRTDVVPGAVVRLPAGGNPSEFLVTGIEEGIVRKVTARQIARGAPPPWTVSTPSGKIGAAVADGPPHAVFLDLPAAVGSGQAQDQFRIAAWQKPWRSQAIFVSPEDTGFTMRGKIAAPARLGRLLEAMPAGMEGRVEPAGSAVVELFDADVASVTLPQLLNGANAAAVRSAAGPWEVLQFGTAEELSPGTWRLSDLLRGQLGTGDAMAAGAPVGADFILLDDAVVPAGLQAGEIGLQLNWRVGPSAGDLSDVSFATSAQTGGVRALLPYAPVHIRGNWNGSDLALSWIRRGRLDADRWDASEIPLAEEAEQYQVAIAPADGGAVRTETVSQPSWLYSAADIAADFDAPPAEVDVTVRQFSAAVGWGIAATRRIALA